MRFERMWERWRDHRVAVEARIKDQQRELERVERLGLEEDWSEELLEGAVGHQRFLLAEERSKRVGVALQFLWFGLVTALSPVLVRASDALDNWMNSPDRRRL